MRSQLVEALTEMGFKWPELNFVDLSLLAMAGQGGGVLPANHFVLGSDKTGWLWTLHTLGYCAHPNQGGSLMFLDVQFAEAAQNTGLQRREGRGGSGHSGQLLVHGGASAAVVDAFAAWAGSLLLGPTCRVTAAQSFVYKRPMIVGQHYLLLVTAAPRNVNSTRTAVVSRSRYVNNAGKVCLRAESTIVIPRNLRSGSKNSGTQAQRNHTASSPQRASTHALHVDQAAGNALTRSKL